MLEQIISIVVILLISYIINLLIDIKMRILISIYQKFKNYFNIF